MRLGLAFQHVVAVIGHQRRDAQLAAHFQQVIADALFDVQPVVHQLQEVVVLAIDVLPHRGGFHCLIELSQAQAGLYVARGATGGGDDALGTLGNQLGIHARPLAVLALIAGHGAQVEEIAQALGGFRHHRLVQVSAGGGDIIALLLRVSPAHAGGAEA